MAREGNRAKHPAQKRYREENRRYKNKIKKATKRYKNCSKLLKYVLSDIKERPNRYKAGN